MNFTYLEVYCNKKLSIKVIISIPTLEIQLENYKLQATGWVLDGDAIDWIIDKKIPQSSFPPTKD